MRLDNHEALPALPKWDVFEAFSDFWQVSDVRLLCMAMRHLPEAELVSKEGLEDFCFIVNLENHEESSRVPW